MYNLALLINNTLKLFIRKKSNVLLLLMTIAVSLIFLFLGFADNSQLKIGIVNKDNSEISEDLIKLLQKTDKFKIIFLDEKEINDKVSRGNVDSAVIIPYGFGEGLIKNDIEKIEIISIKSEDVTILLKNYLNQEIANLSGLAFASKGNIETFKKMYEVYKNYPFNLKTELVKDETKSILATRRSLGFFIMFLMVNTTSIANLILQEKRDKTFYRVLASPVKPKTYLLSNFLLNVFVALLQIVIILLLLALLLGLNFNSSLFEIFLVLISFAIVSISLSMMIISFSSSTNYASNLTTLIVTPTCMIGGVFWPVNMMPKLLQKLSDFMPQKWAIDAIDKLQTGSGFGDIYINIATLLAFAGVFMLIAIYKINRSEKMSDFV